jgi:hypothetical protein
MKREAELEQAIEWERIERDDEERRAETWFRRE